LTFGRVATTGGAGFIGERHPIATLDVGTLGTRHAPDPALAKRARFLFLSTSEV
jgi:hypothetical protein